MAFLKSWAATAELPGSSNACTAKMKNCFSSYDKRPYSHTALPHKCPTT